MSFPDRISENLDKFENDLPSLPAGIVHLNRAVVGAALSTTAQVLGAVGGAVGAVTTVASTAARTVAGQARRGIEDTGDVVGASFRRVGNRTLSVVDDVTTEATDGARSVAAEAKRGATRTTKTARTQARTVTGQARAQTEKVAKAAEANADKLADRATDAVDPSPGSGRPYERWSRAELYERAQELDVDGRSGMSKQQLIKALRSAA